MNYGRWPFDSVIIWREIQNWQFNEQLSSKFFGLLKCKKMTKNLESDTNYYFYEE